MPAWEGSDPDPWSLLCPAGFRGAVSWVRGRASPVNHPEAFRWPDQVSMV